MIVHAAPPATWKNVSGHSLLDSIATISSTATTATSTSPRARHDLEVGPLDWRRVAGSAWTAGAGITVSVMPESYRVATPPAFVKATRRP